MSKNKKGPKGRRSDDSLHQLGLIPGMGEDDDDDDEDLEDELLALVHGTSAPSKKKRSPKAGMNVDLAAIDRMAQDAMNVDDDDVDEDDAELLAELQQLSSDEESKPAPEPSPQPSPSRQAPPSPAHQMAAPAPAARAPSPRSSGNQGIVSLLEERLEMYNSAYSSAQADGNSSKARRMNRGAKTLKDLIKQARAGKAIPEDDIPPVVHGSPVGSRQDSPANTPMETAPTMPLEPVKMDTQPVTPASPPKAPAASSLSAELQRSIDIMAERRDQYKLAAVQAKRSGDLDHARSHFKTAKQFDSVIEAATAGNPIDLSKMPPPPPSASTPSIHVEHSSNQGHGEVAAAADDDAEPEFDVPEDSSVDKDLFGAPDAPKTIMDALQQRFQKYKSTVDKAKEEGNSGKARRMGRIAKQYQDAIKAHKLGRPVDFSELPTPPGFAPIPTGSSQPQTMSPPAASPAPSSSGATQLRSPAGSVGKTSPVAGSPQKRKSGELPVGKAQQQRAFLLDRQKQFKLAALKAKQSGDREQAMAYLRQAKGFDPMIQSLENGVRVDMSKVPRPPGMEEESLSSYEFVEPDDCAEPGDRDEMFKKLEQDLIEQIRTSSSNSNHFTHTGDIASADRFDKLGQNCRKDLDALKNAYKHGDPVPRFHYETKQFKLFKCCTDLGDSDLELVVVRGIHYNPPSGYSPDQLDTYVKYEFPFPTDDCPKGTTDTFKSNACPEYNESFKIPINRKSRSFQRMMKMKTIKLEVFYRRGFLKSDKVLGTASIKLQPLENHCELHECLDLMDGRRPCGGRLEIKVRIRQPLVSKEEEEVKEKWLVIDKFNRALTAGPSHTRTRSRSPAANTGAASIEVLKYEKKLLDNKIITYQKQLNPSQITALQQKGQQLQEQAVKIQQDLRQGGANAYRSYAAQIEQSTDQYVQEAKALMDKGDRDKAKIALSKKTLIEREVAAIRSKIPA